MCLTGPTLGCLASVLHLYRVIAVSCNIKISAVHHYTCSLIRMFSRVLSVMFADNTAGLQGAGFGQLGIEAKCFKSVTVLRVHMHNFAKVLTTPDGPSYRDCVTE